MSKRAAGGRAAPRPTTRSSTPRSTQYGEYGLRRAEGRRGRRARRRQQGHDLPPLPVEARPRDRGRPAVALDDDEPTPDTGDTRAATSAALRRQLIAMLTDHADRPRAADDGRRRRARSRARRRARTSSSRRSAPRHRDRAPTRHRPRRAPTPTPTSAHDRHLVGPIFYRLLVTDVADRRRRSPTRVVDAVLARATAEPRRRIVRR